MKPLYDKICEYVAKNPARFHMPAHFGTGDNPLFSSAKYDVTELDFSDNLQNPTGVILESEMECAKTYGAKNCFYLTSGSTTGVFIAMSAIRNRTDEIIVARSSHKSVYAAARTLGFKVRYIPSSFDKNEIPLPVTEKDVETALEQYPSAGACVITSPNYFGMTADAKSISALVKKSGKILFVDEAHGAHFPFSERFEKGFSGFSDISVTSFHKTLPVYSGGAALFCNNDTLTDDLLRLRADLHTTSPCYLTLASMDYSIDERRISGEEKYENLFEKVNLLKEKLPLEIIKNDDFTRLVVRCGDNGFSALRQKNVVPEMTFYDLAVFILSPENEERIDDIYDALKDVKCESAREIPPLPAPVFKKATGGGAYLPLHDAIGHVSLGEVGTYPPGIPVVAYGEVITENIADFLKDRDVFGFVNGRLYVTIDK